MVKRFLFVLILISQISFAQEEGGNSLEVDFNSYFDNFRLVVVYPTISINKSLDSKTSVNASYLVDAISSASMRMTLRVDGITSATKTTNGGKEGLTELRHQLNAGVSRFFGDVSVSLNGMYSTEHDYSAKTLAANISIPVAKKNTIFQLGLAGNWDKVFPQTRTWTKDRNTQSINLGMSQILSKNLIAQIDFTFMNVEGFMLDGYQVVRIVNGNTLKILEPITPDKRMRKAFGGRINYGVTKNSTLKFGYRYYWDTWEIKSHTFEAGFKTHLSENVNLLIDYRRYIQTKAYFFKPVYLVPEPLMAVDSKLNSGYTNDISLGLNFKGGNNIKFPLLGDENLTLITKFGFYHRHTDSPDWFSRLNDLYAYLITIGFKYNF
ncbi:MAG: DUF3570 domain-containing protein [Ignavibacteria bacterium]